MNIEKLNEIINSQQEGKEGTPEYMMGEQIKDIARRESETIEILFNDLHLDEMNLTALSKHFKEYSDNHRNGARCFCITPDVADGLIREFYGLSDKTDGNGDSGIIDISDFL